MNKVLVDSSVWIDFFSAKNSKTDLLIELIENNNLCVNEAILAELIPYLTQQKEHKVIRLLEDIECFSVVVDWKRIISFQNKNLKNGLNKVGLVDLMILQSVLDNNLILYSFDKHFKIMSKLYGFKIVGA